MLHNLTLATADECLEAAVVQGESGELLAGLWYVGVIMSILSSIASNLGVNIQKLSMTAELRKLSRDPSHQEKAYIFQRTWLIGLVFVIAGSIGDFAALGFAAQSLATPVGGFTMVANVVFAHFFLHEKLCKRDLVATALVVIGVVLVAASADKTEKTFALDCLLKLYERAVFIGYLVLLFFIMGLIYMLTRWFEKQKKENPRGESYRRWKRLHPVCPAALSGLIGAQSVLFAKCSAELIKSTINGENQFAKWQTYVIILCMVFTIFNQLHWLAVGLRSFDAVLIIPVFQCFFITGGVIGGGVMFAEFSHLKTWEKILFVVGVGITVAGVVLLSQRDHDQVIAESASKVIPEFSGGTDEVLCAKEGDDGEPNTRPTHRRGRSSSQTTFDRPRTPMPLSLQYHSLAMSDVYNAIRNSLSTPDRVLRRAGTVPTSAMSSINYPNMHTAFEKKRLAPLPSAATIEMRQLSFDVPAIEVAAAAEPTQEDGATLATEAQEPPVSRARSQSTPEFVEHGTERASW
mmetsp:Transcript_25787/g.73040  ORF Transcript_25787/g.73040 Transcript_25787/m.73040 type:complete len:519 (+) Transcript_25787:194-1750(+)